MSCHGVQKVHMCFFCLFVFSSAVVPLVPVVIPLALDRNFILTFDETTSPQSIQL